MLIKATAHQYFSTENTVLRSEIQYPNIIFSCFGHVTIVWVPIKICFNASLGAYKDLFQCLETAT